MSFGVTYKVTKMFFDRATVVREVGKINAKALSKAGAFVRRRARSSLRRRKRVSAPGSPPSVHSSSSVATIKNILFAYDRANMSVVIGPVLLNQVQQSAIDRGSLTVPEIQEFGGPVNIQEEAHKSDMVWRRRDMRRGMREWKRYRVRRAVYPTRPFMGPALAAEAPNFPSLWASSARAAA